MPFLKTLKFYFNQFCRGVADENYSLFFLVSISSTLAEIEILMSDGINAIVPEYHEWSIKDGNIVVEPV